MHLVNDAASDPINTMAVQGGPQDWRRFELRTRSEVHPAPADSAADDGGQLQLEPPQRRVSDVPAFLAASQAAILATGAALESSAGADSAAEQPCGALPWSLLSHF